MLILEPAIEEIYSKIILLLYMIYMNQIGRFPIWSKFGNNYLIVLYDYNSNAIIAEDILDQKSQTLQNAFLKLFNTIK